MTVVDVRCTQAMKVPAEERQTWQDCREQTHSIRDHRKTVQNRSVGRTVSRTGQVELLSAVDLPVSYYAPQNVLQAECDAPDSNPSTAHCCCLQNCRFQEQSQRDPKRRGRWPVVC
jgi:hypothetical protein